MLFNSGCICKLGVNWGIGNSTAMNLVHRNSFPKLSNFSWYFTQLGKFRREANDKKHADPGKKNRNSRKSRENSWNLSEAFLRSRKEENLYGHCDMNNAWKFLSKGSTPLRGCWFWSEKLHFQKNFGRNFILVEEVRSRSVHIFGTCVWRTAAQWRFPGKKRVSTQEKSGFVIALRFSKRKYRSCAQP